MGQVFFDVGVSLDGFIAGPNRRPGNPLGDGGIRIHEWLFRTAYFRELLGMPGGEASKDDGMVRAIFARAGAYVMGRRMFDEGEVGWPEEAPFHAPVLVLTHSPRDPWPRKGGTTFVFVADGIASALAQARAAAGGRDVRISGGAAAIRQFLEAEQQQVTSSPLAAHIRYRILRPSPGPH
jgi:dihydrofolate reductase